jgi:hypothetical protein
MIRYLREAMQWYDQLQYVREASNVISEHDREAISVTIRTSEGGKQ